MSRSSAAKYEVLCEHKHVAEAAKAPWRRWTRCGPPRRRSVGPARAEEDSARPPAAATDEPALGAAAPAAPAGATGNAGTDIAVDAAAARAAPTADLPLTRVARA